MATWFLSFQILHVFGLMINYKVVECCQPHKNIYGDLYGEILMQQTITMITSQLFQIEYGEISK